MESDSLYIARLEPYRVSDLQHLLETIEDDSLVKVSEIGSTVEGRPLEIVRVGHVDSPHRIFIRARAHAWEPGGNLHIARPNVNLESYLANMERFEHLLLQHTWFTEGSTGSNFRNPGSIGGGLLERFGIDAVVYELNANWIEGLKKVPLGRDWELLGRQLHDVFYEYFHKD